MTDVNADTPAQAGDMDDAAADALFAELSAAKTAGADAPEVKTEEDPKPKPGEGEGAETPEASATDPAPTQEAAAAADAAAATKDIWADAPPELRAAHEAEMQRWDQKYRSDIGRQASYQRRISALEAELKAKSGAAPAAGAEPAETKTPIREQPKIKQALEDYPEVVAPILEALEPLLSDTDNLRRDVQSLTEHRREAVISDQEKALEAAHPDWKAATSSPEFVEWLGTRPKAVREMIERNAEEIVDAEEAITVVGDFKAHYALTHPKTPNPQEEPKPAPARDPAPTTLADRRAKQLAAVTTAPASRGGAQPVPGGAGDDDAVFNHFVSRKQAKR